MGSSPRSRTGMVKALSSRLGFIGLGKMGLPMAHNLGRAGFQLSVFDQSQAAMQAFERSSVRVCASPLEVAQQADILFTMLPESRHVRAALFGSDGAVEGLDKGALVVDMGTGDPLDTLELAADLAVRGIEFMDAPVCRSPREAVSGELLILAGGTVANLVRVRPAFDALGEQIFHVGGVGAGLRLKLVNNYLAMVQMVVAAEGLMFAAKLGIDRQIAIELFSKTPAGKGQLLTNYPRKVLRGDVTPDFPLSMGLKDLALALKLGAFTGVPLPLGAAARELYALAKPWGRADEDCSAMLLLLEDIARVAHAPVPQVPQPPVTP
jgi:4-hydroxybutyrate dehydrogenase / sulfolactaldehyde 3-reductase